MDGWTYDKQVLVVVYRHEGKEWMVVPERNAAIVIDEQKGEADFRRPLRWMTNSDSWINPKKSDTYFFYTTESNVRFIIDGVKDSEGRLYRKAVREAFPEVEIPETLDYDFDSLPDSITPAQMDELELMRWLDYQ